MAASIVNTIHDGKTLESLFRTVRADIEQIRSKGRKDIKKVIQKLAYDLEGIIAREDISLTIKYRLKGLVTARFVDMCLDAKYKKEYRIQNARQRVKQPSLAELLLKPIHKSNALTGPSDDVKKANLQCGRCNDLYLKIDELESALSETSRPRNLEVIEFEFPLEFRIIQEYMTNASQYPESSTQLWFNVKVEKISGKVICASTGRISGSNCQRSGDHHD